MTTRAARSAPPAATREATTARAAATTPATEAMAGTPEATASRIGLHQNPQEAGVEVQAFPISGVCLELIPEVLISYLVMIEDLCVFDACSKFSRIAVGNIDFPVNVF